MVMNLEVSLSSTNTSIFSSPSNLLNRLTAAIKNSYLLVVNKYHYLKILIFIIYTKYGEYRYEKEIFIYYRREPNGMV
jgi:hypothetical protein